MKKMKLKSILYFVTITAMFSACSNENAISEMKPSGEQNSETKMYASIEDKFAQRNGEVFLSGSARDPMDYERYYNDPVVAEHACSLMCVADTNMAAKLNGVVVSDEHLAEIKNFVESEILSTESTQYAKMLTIIKWVRNNIKYDYNDQDAYSVFKNRVAVCQGYSNLTVAMLHTQGIKATVVTGYLANAGGHAWVYVLADKIWYVADPTNRTNVFKMEKELDKYKTSLQTWNIDMPLYQDENFVYDFRNKHFNIRQVLTSAEQVSVPFGALGYIITGFDPIDGINEHVRELYMSYNVFSIGEFVQGMREHGNGLENIYVWNEKNHHVNEYDGCVYSVDYDSNTKVNTLVKLLYVPGAKREVNYAPIAKIESKVIEGLPNVEVIKFDAATLEFEDYAITSSPNLKEVHINKNAKVSSKAFEELPAGCQVIYYDPTDTGIRPIFM